VGNSLGLVVDSVAAPAVEGLDRVSQAVPAVAKDWDSHVRRDDGGLGDGEDKAWTDTVAALYVKATRIVKTIGMNSCILPSIHPSIWNFCVGKRFVGKLCQLSAVSWIDPTARLSVNGPCTVTRTNV
jgi:hypothetical protein